MSATVQDVMTTDVVAVRRDASFKDVATMLGRHRVSAFPVIDDGKVIGVVSEADLLPKEALVAGSGLVPGRLSVMLHHREFSKAGGITVTDGVVTIAGGPETAESGRGIVSAIWLVEGVVSVRDLLTYPPGPAQQAPSSPRRPRNRNRRGRPDAGKPPSRAGPPR